MKAPKESEEKYAHSKLEMYDYHHKYDEKDKGERHAQFRLEAEQAFDYRRRIHGDAASIHPGGLVTVERHPTASENQEYLIVGARHMYLSQQYGSGGGGTGDTYSGSYDIPVVRCFSVNRRPSADADIMCLAWCGAVCVFSNTTAPHQQCSHWRATP